MADNPRPPPAQRKTLGTVLGPNRAPPRESEMPDADRETVLTWLRNVSEQMKVADVERNSERARDLVWRSGVEDRFKAYDEQLRELREQVVLGKEIRGELRDQARIINELAQDVREVVRSDAGDKIDIAKLEARVTAAVQQRTTAMAQASGTEAGAAAGADAGKRSGKLWGGLAVGLTLLATIIEHCGPAIVKVLNQ